MKRSTAVGHLADMGEVATDKLRFVHAGMRWPLTQMWVTRELLTPAETIEAGAVVLVLDLPCDQVTWLARNSIAEWVGADLGLGKRPLHWFYRPASWPVCNHEIRRATRIWTAEGGVDSGAIEALRSRRLDQLSIVEPSDEELAQQVRNELTHSREHLRSVLANYWERDWRRSHKGFDQSPEDHLWRAASAVSEMLDFLAALDN